MCETTVIREGDALRSVVETFIRNVYAAEYGAQLLTFPSRLFALKNEDSEIICDTSSSAGARLVMNNCLLKMGNIREPFVQFDATLFNQDPLFKNTNNVLFFLFF